MNEKIDISVTIKPWNIALVTALTATFIVLKILGYINWSWVWILSPLWIDAILMIVMLIIAIIGFKIINLKKK